MASNKTINDPISHCPKGQGGRTFSRSKPGVNKNGKGSEHLSLRQKVQPKPSGSVRFPHGRYYDWDKDPDGLNRKLGITRLAKKKA